MERFAEPSVQLEGRELGGKLKFYAVIEPERKAV